ncbi:hypothetical protein PORY_001502 [Pneumocystis oryctolagi]|uniref:Uncharacterized protein n=1 Tax=Pneumocystis oryctolagi TaxID=42067 RepID=A0ACB7CE25_9ASCO|nr:hypothetical protein PORY_001502 [Pneumocystis oryctolagi]
MSTKQKKRAENGSKTASVMHKKWSHMPSRFSPKAEFDSAAKHMHDRMLFLIINLVGRIVTVSLKNGVRYKGILGSVNTDSDMGLVLKMATLISPADSEALKELNGLQNRIIDELIILPYDLMQIHVERVNFNETIHQEQKFQTDAEISGKVGFKERELHKWVPSNNDAEEFGPLEDPNQLPSSGEVWDQFAANEMLFGVKSEFDEDFYTTKVDKFHPSYKRREAEAARIAQEIQQSSTNNIHIAEERGFIQTDISEEAMYSGVFGPSSQDKEESLEATKREMNAAIVSPAFVENHTSTTPQSTGLETNTPKQSSVVMPNSPVNKDKKGTSDQNVSNASKTPKIETELMGTFKQFVSGERERLQARKQALIKKEKDVKLQELLKFSQNFKLNTPVPSDLMPILAKDKIKHDETTAKPTNESSELSVPVSNQSSEPASHAQVTSNPSQQNLDSLRSSQNTEKTSQKLNVKLNVKASIFKPNSMMNSYTQYAQKVEGHPLDTSTFQPPPLVKTLSPPDFFNNKKPESIERKPILKNFDPFKRYRMEHPDSKHSSEKPYSFVPTWPCGQKSYKEMLHALQQSMNLPKLGQSLYDPNEDYRFSYIDPNSLNFVAMPYGPSLFYPIQHQDAAYGGFYSAYRNFTSQMIQPTYSAPGHLVKLLYMTPHIMQNMAYHPQHGICIPPQLMSPQNYNSQAGQPVLGYSGPRNTPMMLQFHPGVQGQVGLQQTFMMTVPTGMNKTVQGNAYGYTG